MLLKSYDYHVVFESADDAISRSDHRKLRVRRFDFENFSIEIVGQ